MSTLTIILLVLGGVVIGVAIALAYVTIRAIRYANRWER